MLCYGWQTKEVAELKIILKIIIVKILKYFLFNYMLAGLIEEGLAVIAQYEL